ncbi:hypothetical protein [Pseudomonas gingeri]|uniref:hypothetical protein n=1 Tax=Pseudomonas gingeri TaxID=117681 RepID=UPI00159FBDAC|nr:hypothetical protein [Pseudomonas gingeri]NWD04207.1 hypothetical protein [Pseudomonas gingeri]NWD46730.1 hypothetical protein [Pseudomonas gingeri]NWE34161.1 hypothetical protein [Pseudomonas gingeri]NWE56587.1 hypothetical protein [Pseudomonas gingeri]NWF01037.1 hypothetical protein [Pseudomonas gingeri]
MNGISRVSPALEVVADCQDETPDKIEQRLEVVEDEVIGAGAATLLALLQRMELPEGGLGRVSASPGDSQRIETSAGSADAPEESPGERAGSGTAQAEGPLKKGDVDGRRTLAVVPGEERGGWEKSMGDVAGQSRDGLDGRPQVMSASDERPQAGRDEDVSSVNPKAGESVPGTELLPGSLPARLEVQALAVPVQSERAGGERESTPDPHDSAPPDSLDQDDEGGGQPFLQVPFSNDRARGEVLVTRAGAGASGLLIRASDRQVFEQLQVDFDQSRQPHWWLGEAPNDGDRRS